MDNSTKYCSVFNPDYSSTVSRTCSLLFVPHGAKLTYSGWNVTSSQKQRSGYDMLLSDKKKGRY